MSLPLKPVYMLLMSPLVLGLTSCDTVYSRSYSYEKTQFLITKQAGGKTLVQKGYNFEPIEQIALARADIEKEKRETERLRLASQRSEKAGADRVGTDSPALRLDSGLDAGSSLGGMGGSMPSGGASIPGLDSPPSKTGASAMGGGSIPGLDSAPSMSGAPTMSGAPSMDGAMAPSMAPAPGAGAPKPASTMLPGL